MFNSLLQLLYMLENFHNKNSEAESMVLDFVNLERKSNGIQLKTFLGT